MDFEAHWETSASVDRVWDVLADGWMFPLWVVGASRMRAVDPDWPAVGSRIHHSVGLWPLLLDDHTEVAGCREQRELELIARAKGFGRARVFVRLNPHGTGCRIDMAEFVHVPPLPEPLRNLVAVAAKPRNTECIHRLALLAEAPTVPHD